ncbi:hypothetical protein V6O07_08580, partial [Arthrospira platensis SPKY2]
MGMYFLRKKASLIIRSRHTLAFDKVKSIILVYSVNENKIPPAISHLVGKLREANKKVTEVVFFSGKSKSLRMFEDAQKLF